MLCSPLVLVMLAGLSIGCRQPDGPMPTPTAEDENKIGDVSRDLLAVAARSPSAVEDLGDDLANFALSDDGARHGKEMARKLAASLEGTKLSEEAAREIATDLFIAFHARELSRGQVAKLRESLESVLTQTGVQQASAEPVLEHVEQVQSDVTTARRRWWQF
jgi:hypothetical protein